MGNSMTQTFEGTPEMFDKFKFNKNITELHFTPSVDSVHATYNGSQIPVSVTDLTVEKYRLPEIF